MTDPVLYERRDHVALITLNRADGRNSMTPDILAGVEDAVRQVQADHGVRAVVLAGSQAANGKWFFSAGADFRSQIQAEVEGVPRMPHEKSNALYQPFLSLLDIEVPVIGALSGHAVGGGFGLSLCCDLRICSASSKYGANFTRLGLHPGLGISYALPRIVGMQRAMELLFTGRLFAGDEGARIGYALEAFAPEDVLPRALALAETIAANAPVAMRMTKRSIYDFADWQMRRAALHEAFAQATTIDTADFREGMNALLEKRAPDFEGR